MKISVAIATYNGGSYIYEQLLSIVQQLDELDEIVVSDDGSSDNTIEIIQKFQEIYSNIKLVKGPRQGVFRNFQNAILHCHNEIVYLADQDDIWVDEKVKKINKIFEMNDTISVVLHNAKILKGKELSSDRLIRKYCRGFLTNFIRSSYWGCCMAFKREFIIQYLYNPYEGIAHDQLIGLFGEWKKNTVFWDEDLIIHRIHANNVSKQGNLFQKIYFRYRLLQDFCICRWKAEHKDI